MSALRSRRDPELPVEETVEEPHNTVEAPAGDPLAGLLVAGRDLNQGAAERASGGSGRPGKGRPIGAPEPLTALVRMVGDEGSGSLSCRSPCTPTPKG